MRFIGSLDTNLILRLILGDIPEQQKLAMQLLVNTQGQVAVADMAIIETVFVLGREYAISREKIAEMIRVFMNIKQINCNRVLFDATLKLFVEHPTESFEDCCLAVYARLNEATPLYTFDRKMAKHLPDVTLLR